MNSDSIPESPIVHAEKGDFVRGPVSNAFVPQAPCPPHNTMQQTFAPSPTSNSKNNYYKLSTGAECIELVEDIADRENIPGRARVLMTNAVEYIWRCGKKQNEDWRESLFKSANELYRIVTGSWMSSEQKQKFFCTYATDEEKEQMR